MSGWDVVQEAARRQFERQAAAYGAGHVLAQTDDLRGALAYLKVGRGERLLDVACGAGHAAVFFAKLGLEVVASDVAGAMLEQTRRLAEQAGVTVRVEQHAAEAMPYGDGTFDVVSCRVAAHHFACPASFCMEAARVLRAGGRFLLIDGTVEEGEPEAEAWLHEVEKLRDPTHGRLIGPLRWRHLCGHVGMRVIHAEVQPLEQPDLEWYFEAAGTPEENRVRVRELVARAPEAARRLFRVRVDEGGKVSWWWQRLVLVAVKL